MTKVYVVIRGGICEEVLCRNKNVEVEIIDFDTQDEDQDKAVNKRYKELTNSKSYKDVLLGYVG